MRRPCREIFSGKGGAVFIFGLFGVFLCGFQLLHPLLQGGDLVVHFQERPHQNSQHHRRRNHHPQGLLAPEQQRIAAEHGKEEHGKQACSQYSKNPI